MGFVPMFDKIRAQLRELNGAKVIVGFQSELGINFNGENIRSDEEMLKIASVHEYGCDITVTPKMRAFLHHQGMHLKADTDKIHIPERSFIRRAQAESMAGLVEEFNKDIEKMFNGKLSADEVLHALGRRAVTAIHMSIGNNVTPITNYTLEHRKSSPNPNPLEDSGNLMRHVTYRIIKKNGKV